MRYCTVSLPDFRNTGYTDREKQIFMLKNTYFKYVKQKTVTEYFVVQEIPHLRSVFEVEGGGGFPKSCFA